MCIYHIHILWCFYHRWIVVIGLYIIYIYTMLSGHPHIFTYIFDVIIVYIICYPGHPHMFTYVYIYILSYRVTHTYTYIYTLNPTTLPLSYHSSNSRFFSKITHFDRITHSLPVASVLIAPHHPNSWQNSPFTTGSERSKEPQSSQFLKEFPIHYR